MQDLFTSVVRTIIPYLVGAIVSWLTTKGLHLSEGELTSVTAYLTFLFGTLYYLVARALEKKWPKLGYLLGIPSEPTY